MQAKTKKKNPFESADYKQKIAPKVDYSADKDDEGSEMSVMSNPNSGKAVTKKSQPAKKAPAKPATTVVATKINGKGLPPVKGQVPAKGAAGKDGKKDGKGDPLKKGDGEQAEEYLDEAEAERRIQVLKEIILVREEKQFKKLHKEF